MWLCPAPARELLRCSHSALSRSPAARTTASTWWTSVTTTGEPPASESAGAGRGPLARMLETRGGRAAPEAPFVIEHREALIYMLCEAAELEHGIMCQYLFAAFSLKQREDEGLSPEQVAAATRWRHVIGHVA